MDERARQILAEVCETIAMASIRSGYWRRLYTELRHSVGLSAYPYDENVGWEEKIGLRPQTKTPYFWLGAEADVAL